MAYLGRQPNTGVRSRFIFTATASQTTFSGTDDDGKTLKYEDAAYVDVFLNGVLLKPVTDYAATTKTSVVLTSAAAASDIVEIVAYDIANIADTVSKANGGTFDAAVTVQGTVTSTGSTVNGNLSVDNGTIKLDGNHPVGSNNVALGNTALDSNVSGASNTAIGANALTTNTASNNTAVGYQAGYSNTTGIGLVAVGALALNSNTTGVGNTAVGTQHTGFAAATLQSNTAGSYNTGIGTGALYANSTASYGTTLGYKAGYSNTTSSSNTYIGAFAGEFGTGANNTFVGDSSGYAITTGAKNSILGRYNGNQGGLDIRTSSNNIVLSDGDGNIGFHRQGNGTVLIGAGNSLTNGASLQIIANSGGTDTYRATTNTGHGIAHFASDVGGTASLKSYINGNGGLTIHSDYRIKENIQDLVNGIDRVKNLRPVSYNIKNGDGSINEGFIAHELQEVIPSAVVGQKDQLKDDGSMFIQGVEYSRIIATLTSALKESIERIETLEAKVAALETP